MRVSLTRPQGFTIIELVCSLVIVSILASVAIPRFLSITDAAHDALVAQVLENLQVAHAQLRAHWKLAGSPGEDSNTQVNIVIDGITVRFRNGQPNTTTNSAHVPAGTPNRSGAPARLFFLFLQTPPQPIIDVVSTASGWVMLGTNGACAATSVVGANPRRCWEYRVNGLRYARISYSSRSGRFVLD